MGNRLQTSYFMYFPNSFLLQHVLVSTCHYVWLFPSNWFILDGFAKHPLSALRCMSSIMLHYRYGCLELFMHMGCQWDMCVIMLCHVNTLNNVTGSGHLKYKSSSACKIPRNSASTWILYPLHGGRVLGSLHLPAPCIFSSLLPKLIIFHCSLNWYLQPPPRFLKNVLIAPLTNSSAPCDLDIYSTPCSLNCFSVLLLPSLFTILLPRKSRKQGAEEII